MLRIIAPEDCGNAPKKVFLKDFNIAFAKGDVSAILECVTDDIRWIRVGEAVIEGKAEFAAALNAMKDTVATELVIDTLITHGNTASANGLITVGGVAYAFCDVYRFKGFKNAKLNMITSYVIDLGPTSGGKPLVT